jgi:hypothetical protein
MTSIGSFLDGNYSDGVRPTDEQLLSCRPREMAPVEISTRFIGSTDNVCYFLMGVDVDDSNTLSGSNCKFEIKKRSP